MLIEYETKTVRFKVEEKSLKIMMYESVNLLNEKKNTSQVEAEQAVF